MNRLIITTLVLLTFVGCSKDEVSAEGSESVEVKFAYAQIATRTSGNDWLSTDEVGIFLTGATTSSDNRDNVRYTSDEDGNFTVYDGVTPLYYPQDEEDEVTIYAYYPYDADLEASAGLYYTTIDLSDQNDPDKGQGAVDFMVSSAITTSKQTAAEELEFYHQLSMLQFTLSHNNEISTLTGVKVTANEVGSSATFCVQSGEMYSSASGSEDLIFTVDSTEDDGSEAVVSVILLPGSLAKGTIFTFEAAGYDGETITSTLTLTEAMTLSSGTKYNCTVLVGRDKALFTGDSYIVDWKPATEINMPLYSQE